MRIDDEWEVAHPENLWKNKTRDYSIIIPMNLQSLPRLYSNPADQASIPQTQGQTHAGADVVADGVADVLIVGGGIVGATLACCLADQNLRVVVVEGMAPAATLENKRAYALTLLTIDIFRALGIWADLEPKVTGFNQICLSDAAHQTVVRFTPQDIGRSELGYVAEHRVILQGLYDRLQGAKHITWIAPAQVQGMEIAESSGWRLVTVGLPNGETLCLKTPLVVAADGANSTLRRQANIPTWGWKYWQSCVGFTVRCDRPHQHIAYEKFWSSGPFAMLPLTNQRCQIVWTAPHTEAAALANLSEPDFLDRLAHRYGVPAQELHLETPRQVFPVRLMQSQTYRADRLALVGDAAHPMLPYMAQGAGMAIEDAQVLVSLALKQVQSGPLDVVDLFERYAQLRWARCARVQRKAIRNGQWFHASGLKAWIRDLGLSTMGGRVMDVPWLYKPHRI